MGSGIRNGVVATQNGDSKSTIQSTVRTVQLLEQLAAVESASLSELALKTGLKKTTCHRFLNTLRSIGYVALDGEGRYVLGTKAFSLAINVYSRIALVQVARDVLDRLAHVTRETVNLAVLDGDNVRYVDKRESPQPLSVTAKVGEQRPAYCTALGKAMLAFADPEWLSGYLSRCSFLPCTPRTITVPGALLSALEEVRSTGVAFDREEVLVGVCCVASPIFDRQAKVAGAVSVTAPAVRVTPEAESHFSRLVREAGHEISRRLGYVGRGFPNSADAQTRGSS